MKTISNTNNSVRHLPLAQLSGRGQGRTFARISRKIRANGLTELLGSEKRKTKYEFAGAGTERKRAPDAQQIGIAPRGHICVARKHWTHQQIAQWLNERGVKITLSSVHRFCQRAVARRPRNNSAPEIAEEKPVFIPTPQTQTQPMPMKKHRFNTDIYENS